jgi:restriction system protein
MIPSSNQLIRPLLEAAAARDGPTDIATLRVPLVAAMNLTPEERVEKLDSGVLTYVNRIAWAKSFLVRAGLLTPGRGVAITAAGRDFLRAHDGPIGRKHLEALPTWTDTVAEKASQPVPATDLPDLSPEEGIDRLVAEANAVTKADLLARLRAGDPAFFERFVRDLLVAMGYGGGLKERGFVTGRTGDGGMDGVVHEDALGLDAVYLRAKRYQPGSNVNAEQVRGFVGAMNLSNASKGVFVTTSDFTPDALRVREKTSLRVVLVNGSQLAELALRHGVGVRAQRTITLQKIDEDYFAGEL